MVLYSYVTVIYCRKGFSPPKTVGGWIFCLLSLAMFVIAGDKGLMCSIFENELLRDVLKIILIILGFVFMILSVEADSKQ